MSTDLPSFSRRVLSHGIPDALPASESSRRTQDAFFLFADKRELCDLPDVGTELVEQGRRARPVGIPERAWFFTPIGAGQGRRYQRD